MVKKYLDTYILVEIYLGNPDFIKYLDEDFILNDITLAEFYGVLFMEFWEEEANYWLRKLESYSVSVEREILIEASKFRQTKKRNISFFDAVGYIFALANKYIFVTGDKEFEFLENVEFKKK